MYLHVQSGLADDVDLAAAYELRREAAAVDEVVARARHEERRHLIIISREMDRGAFIANSSRFSQCLT